MQIEPAVAVDVPPARAMAANSVDVRRQARRLDHIAKHKRRLAALSLSQRGRK
jgi:hypothetical protein